MTIAITNCNGTDLLNKYGVDLYIGAHEHSYERNYAIYRGQVMSKDYDNPGAPAYVVAGAAGVRTLSHSLSRSVPPLPRPHQRRRM